MHDIVVVGAGIAGLTAAWELQARGLRPVVLEGSDRAGGVIRTETLDGFVIDAGPDSLLVQKPAAVDLCRALGIADRLIPTLQPRIAFVLRGTELVPLPEASYLGFPTRLGPFVTSGLFSWPGKMRMAAELMLAARTGDEDESIGSFVRRRFGDEAVSTLAEPLLAGIHVGDVERLSVHALFPRLVQAERAGGVLRTLATAAPAPQSAHGAFMSFPGGIAEIVGALAREVGDAAIRYRTRVARIEGRQPFTLTLDSGESIVARSVILATPAPTTATLVPAIDRDLARLCADIPYASSATVVFGVRRRHVARELRGSGFVVPSREGINLTAATFVSSKWPRRAPSDMVLLRGFLGGAKRETVLSRNDDELAALAFAELAPILGISGEPTLERVYRWPQSTPQYEVGHLARVRAIEARLAHVPGLFVSGSGYRGTGIPDCIADARATAVAAASGLGALR
jgi:protoporphyrinogen/coproporphyrinogen III oxidase